MGFLRNRLLRRFTVLGRAADLLMVAGAIVRIARSRGWIGDDTTNTSQFSSTEPNLSRVGEIALGAGTVWRLLRRRKQRRIAIASRARRQR